jgi:hypothetical protein
VAQRGLEDLWEDLMLAQYLDGELDREEAIACVGRTKVERAEREMKVVEEDTEWGLIRPCRTLFAPTRPRHA